MAIDIRATVTCSLGPLIQANIGDDYIQGVGLIKTTGSCQIKGIATPAVGTVVTFSYTKNGITRRVPRTLRVLSSFADPYRRVTQVELGCKLTYLQDLREAIDWSAFDDPENDGVTPEEAQIVTIPIHASSVMNECLSRLGIASTGAVLTNKFSIEKFDFSGGYVDILSNLLVSEGYCGYLDRNEVLQVFRLDDATGSSVVIGQNEIIDLGSIGSGDLPGESVVVNYSSLKLKQATVTEEDDEEEIEKINWESDETIGLKEYIEATYKKLNQPDEDFFTQWTYIPRSLTVTTYDNWDRVQSRKTTNYYIGAKVNTQYYVDNWAAATRPGRSGVSYHGFYEISPQQDETVQSIEYALPAPVVPIPGQEPPEDYDKIVKEVTIKREPLMALAGAIAGNFLDEDGSIVDYMPLYGDYECEETTVAYENDTKTVAAPSGRFVKVPVTKTITTQRISWGKTQQGQQELSRQIQTGATTKSTAIYRARQLITLGSTVNTVIGRSLDLQSRPSKTDRVNGAYAEKEDGSGDWSTEGSSELVLALGSATAQRITEFSLPYAPDDTFTKTGEIPVTYRSTKSDAPQKAANFGRIQNRLLLGNRSGMNVQIAPERVPEKPFSSLTVQANGLSALYRTNGTTWTMDAQGIIAGTDALFWGAVGGTGDFWFPTAPSIVTLPVTPPVVDTSPDQIIGSVPSIIGDPQVFLDEEFPESIAGDGVQASDSGEFWVYNGTSWDNAGTTPGPSMVVETVVPVWNETVKVNIRVRSKLSVRFVNYAFNVLTEAENLGVRASLQAFRVRLLEALVGTGTVTGQAIGLIRRSFLRGAAGDFALTGLSAGNVRTRSIGTNAGVFTAAAEQAGLLFGRLPLNAEDTAFAASGQTALLRIFTTYLLAGSGDFTLTGQEATSPQTYLGVESGTFLLDTPTADLNRSSILRGDVGSYSAAGQSADLQYIQVVAPVKVLFYTGNGATGRSITGAGFEPGFVGIKGRTFAMNHAWHDIVRGKNTAGYLWVRAGESAPEQIPDTGSTISTRGVQDFTADGFTMNGSSIVNFSGANYFALCLEKGSNVSANVNGSITTQVSTQSDLEYSAFTYTGNGTANQTIGHGLSGSPELVIIKQRTGDFSWVGGTVVGDNNFLRFTNNTVTETSTALFQSFNSSTIAIGDTFNQNNFTYCGWAFKSKTGKSSISTFTGSGSGQHVVNLGYKPQFVMIKNTASTTGDWLVYYTLDGATGYAKELKFNTTAAEVTSTTVQITSTGFSVDVGGPGNISGGATSALYLAFADFSPPPPLVMVSSAGSYLVSGSDSNLGTVYNVTNSGASSYLINEAANPTLTVIRGVTYFFDVNAPGHPFWLQTTAGAYDSLNTYSVGVTSGGTAEGRITWQVALDAPSPLYYVCQFHSSMNGQINVVNYALKLDVGSFTLDGQSSILQPAIRLPADLGEFVFSGQSVGSVSNAVLSGATGVYEVSVADVALITNLLLIATEDNFTLSGFSSDAFILKAFIAPGSSSFDLNGQLAEFTRTAALESAAASYALSGLPVALVYQDLGPTVSVGTEAPLLGATGAVDFTGWTRIQNANADDANIQVTGWPFTFTLANTGYTSGFVGSNSYITFGGGSSAYSGLSASNPNFPKIHFGAADNSYQRVYTKIEDDKAVRIRYEGNGSTSGTLGSPGIVVELAFFKPSASGEQLVELRVGNHNRTSGLFMIASASTSYASATIAANSSWVFVGNNTGTSWTLTSNRYVSQPVRNLTMTASAGSYQATGQDVQLSIILGASLDAGSLLLNGQTADFVVSLSLAAERGVYSVIGENLGSDNYFSSWAIQTFGYESLIYPDWWAD